jgi:hypothetical protein
MKLVGHSFSLEGDATHNLPENQEPPQSLATNQEQETKRRSLPLSQPKAGGHKDPETGAETKSKGSVREQEPTMLTAKGQDDGAEDESHFVDDAARNLPGAS